MTTPDPDPSRKADPDDRQELVLFLRGIVRQERTRLVRGEASWVDWLDKASRYGQYGFANTLLIGAQQPAASEVRPYREWRQQGRQVRRGETAIRILTRGGDVRSVFDIGQTDGPPTEPSPPSSPTQSLAGLAAKLGAWIQRSQRWAYTGPPQRVIHIAPTSSDEAAAVVLGHQLAHLRLHDGVLDRPDSLCHGVRRVEADSVAYLLVHYVARAASPIHFPHVQSWAGTDTRANPAAAVTVVGDRVLRTAAWLINRLDSPRRPAEPPTRSSNNNLPKATEREALAVSAADPMLDELITIQAEAHAFFLRQWNDGWVPDYLAQRGFSREVQQQWGIGYAPRAWRLMTEHLRSRGHSDAAILASGLARRDRKDRLFDTFRDRAMLPIRRPDGTIAGFIGRTTTHGAGPKYLNSPASPLFRKGELLYGLHEVRQQLAHGARPVLVEGPLDAIAVNVASEAYAAVAPCGTSITAEHITTLAEVCDLRSVGLLLALDGDQAGQRAMLQAWPILAQVTGPLHAVVLPKSQDPADILCYQGCMAISKTLSSAIPLTELAIDAAIERAAQADHTLEGKLAAARVAAATLALRPPSEFADQVTRIATRLNITPSHVTTALTEAISTAEPSPGHLTRRDFPTPPTPQPTQPPTTLPVDQGIPPSTARRTR